MALNKLEVTANVAIIVAAACVVLKFTGVLDTPRAAPTARSQVPQYVVGDTLPHITGLELARADQTLLLVVHNGCKYCADGMPFFRQIVQRRNAKKTKVVVVSRNSEPDLAAYLGEHNLVADAKVSIGDAGLKFQMTPTIMLVDKLGVVKRIWTGLPSSQVKEDIIDAVE